MPHSLVAGKEAYERGKRGHTPPSRSGISQHVLAFEETENTEYLYSSVNICGEEVERDT